MNYTITSTGNDNLPTFIITDDTEEWSLNCYLAAHRFWGEMNWTTMTISDNTGEEIEYLLNSSTMTPTLVKVERRH
jgi:hypothetical protein